MSHTDAAEHDADHETPKSEQDGSDNSEEYTSEELPHEDADGKPNDA